MQVGDVGFVGVHFAAVLKLEVSDVHVLFIKLLPQVLPFCVGCAQQATNPFVFLGNHGDFALVFDEFPIQLAGFLQPSPEFLVFLVEAGNILFENTEPSLDLALVIGNRDLVALDPLLVSLVLLSERVGSISYFFILLSEGEILLLTLSEFPR